ncbi:MAG TPA: bile acid:sodium symporter family protein [Opitutaceae bacterium]|nr:bile acid:sodium symporter family protein [Opitutaceae bacterium]HRJ47222.1 bile acid:sodium symporter family protein [Opitutaceae bacterium]
MNRLLALLTNAFPVWVLGGGVLALFQPAWFTWFSGPWIVWGLAVIMLGMGMTLTLDDFRRVLTMPKPVALGFVAQFSVMPLLGWGIGLLLGLDTPFAVGLILVACCPGGTASNIVTFLARADVALSVVMTAVSTLAAVIMTPFLTQLLAGSRVPVDALGLLWSTLQVVILPVLAGVAINRFFPRVVRPVLPVAPLVSALTVALICASIIGQSATAIRASAGVLLLAVFMLHAGGFGLGYGLARLLGFGCSVARTVSIEVGMQNSGLGVVLARRHFADPLTAVPCAISSVFHSVIGSVLAGWWRLRDRK